MTLLDKISGAMTLETTSFIIIISLFALYFHVRFTYINAHKAPAILTTCGILGTFLGIALGLLDFDPNNIQKSVPALIDGIKTAFWVSAWGILCALTVKLREALLGIPKTENQETYQGTTADDLASLLKEIKTALVGTDETTLIGQIKLARQDSNDRIDGLRKSLDEFCEKVAESNSKALIEALKEVIADFNSKINEQFGENFKHLNQAMGKILEWQERYRQQLTDLIAQQEITSKNIHTVAEGMTIATDRYQTLMQKAEVFTEASRNLSNLLEKLSQSIQVIDTQRGQIQQSLEMLGGLINHASAGLPMIEEKVLAITDQLDRSVKATGNEFKEALLSSIKSSTQNIESEMKNLALGMTSNLKNTNEELRSILINTMETTNKEVNENIQKINTEINSNVHQLVEQTKEQVIILDKALSEELTKSLESFGRQMASLSQKFSDDYTPITHRLNEVLDIARKVA